jgi:glycosyltransferase involved in cell wall biosynthesis
MAGHSVVSNKVLVIGPSSSTLVRQRVEMLGKMGFKLHWYSQSVERVDQVKMSTRITNIRVVGGLLELLHVFLLLCFLQPTYVHLFYAKNRWLNLILALHPRLIVTVMGSDISDTTVHSQSLDFKLVKLLLHRAKVITSKSNYMDNILQRFSVPVEKVKRITWGIDKQKFDIGLDSSSIRTALGIPEGANVFFSLRGCKPLYQHEMVIRAFACFVSDSPNSVLLISTMGASDAYLVALKSLVAESLLKDSVIFLPTIQNSDMPLYYSLSDAVVSVPKSDGMPQSIYESMACGCFHILGDLPQYYEIVESEKSGIYIDMSDDRTLTAAFHWVVARKAELDLLAVGIRKRVLPLIDQDIQQQSLQLIYQKLKSDQHRSGV